MRSLIPHEFQEDEYILLCRYSIGCRKTCALVLLDWEARALALDFPICADNP
jgi:hypothetical protein